MSINISIKIKDIIWTILDTVFIFGAVVSIIAAIYNPELYNLIIVGLYALVSLLDSTVFKKPNYGLLSDENTGLPLSYAIVNIYREGSNTPIIKKVADKYGKYYTLVPSGRYHISVDNKNDDGSYTEVFYTKDIDIKDGVVNYDIEV